MGRPSAYNEKTARKLCEGLAAGLSLRQVCQQDGMPGKSTVLRWLFDEDKQDFWDQYARAREIQLHGFSDELTDLSDAAKDVQKAKLQIDTRKWLLSKLLPKKYGEKQQLEHSGPDGGPVQVSKVEIVPGGQDS